MRQGFAPTHRFRPAFGAYDALHRPTQETWLESDGVTVVNTIDVIYDAIGRVTTISDDDSAYFYVHGPDGRLVQVDNAGTPGVPNVVLYATYDAAGNRTQFAAEFDFAGDIQNDYTYDALHRLTRIEQSGQLGGNPVSEKRVDLAYNAASEYTTISRYEDLAGTQLVATSTYTHDAAGRLTALTHAKGANTLANYSWTYDAADRVTQFTSTDGTTDYSYDTTDQLAAAAHVNRQGNGFLRVQASFVPEVDGRLFPAAGVDRIVAVLCEGHDLMTIAGNISLPSLIDAGGGNDHVNGGGGSSDVILGRGGDDHLNGAGGDASVQVAVLDGPAATHPSRVAALESPTVKPA
jgi:YD repeat-containing protein